MFDIVHKFNVLLCFNKGSINISDPISFGETYVDGGVLPQNGSPMKPHTSGV